MGSNKQEAICRVTNKVENVASKVVKFISVFILKIDIIYSFANFPFSTMTHLREDVNNLQLKLNYHRGI